MTVRALSHQERPIAALQRSRARAERGIIARHLSAAGAPSGGERQGLAKGCEGLSDLIQALRPLKRIGFHPPDPDPLQVPGVELAEVSGGALGAPVLFRAAD